jgi:quercetin dioxygenase-like cupin family protein
MTRIDENPSVVSDSEAPQRPPLKFNIFDGAPVEDLYDLMEMPSFPQVVEANYDNDDFALYSQGFVTDPVFCDRDPGGFSLVNIRLAPEAILANHTHNVDCLYYVLSGWVMLGKRRLESGSGFFVPADHAYGYRAGSDGAAVLEFRHATQFNMVFTETSKSRWQEVFEVARHHDGWPGFTESAALRP